MAGKACTLQPAIRNLQPATRNLQPATCNIILHPDTYHFRKNSQKHLEISQQRVILLLNNLTLMLDSLVTSQTRIKLLKKFFLNSSTKAHLRGLETEFGESSNAIRVELNRFERSGLLTSLRDGNKKVFQANSSHPLFSDIHSIIMKETGIDRVIEKVIHRLGKSAMHISHRRFCTGPGQSGHRTDTGGCRY